jgi:hypothetical protein
MGQPEQPFDFGKAKHKQTTRFGLRIVGHGILVLIFLFWFFSSDSVRNKCREETLHERAERILAGTPLIGTDHFIV